jgi:hypothetical protein
LIFKNKKNHNILLAFSVFCCDFYGYFKDVFYDKLNLLIKYSISC